jgi:menaquinone-dependent protoporphyrinogen oxidase
MSIERISRRDLLKAAGLGLGAAAAACSGLSVAGSPQPQVTFPSETMGGTMTARRILVAYASRGGSTTGVAQAIGRRLADGGVQVDVRPMREVLDLSPYGAVVAGSAIRGSAWLPEAMDFLRLHRSALQAKPFAAFLVCITLAMPGGAGYGQFVRGFLKDVRALVTPCSEACFAGALDYSTVPLVPDGLQLRLLSAASRTPPGDYRDWEAIAAWAAQLPRLLDAAASAEGSHYAAAPRQRPAIV